MMQPDHSEIPKRETIDARSYQPEQPGDTKSVQRQIDLCKAYCVEHGYVLLEDHIYCEGDATPVEEVQPPGIIVDIVDDTPCEQQ